MRLKERIPIILSLLKDDEGKKKFLEYVSKEICPPGTQFDLFKEHYIPEPDKYLKLWSENSEQVEQLWLDNPDLRLTQVLVTAGIIPNVPGGWFYAEETNIVMFQQMIEPRDICFWGQNYDSEGNLLSETRWILVKDMSTDHIQAILKDVEDERYRVDEGYQQLFHAELALRKNNGKV